MEKITRMPLNMIKLSVGSESVESLAEWQATRRAQTADGLPRHVTRMWPRRGDEILGGGSMYWVIQGLVLCRQRILRFDEATGQDGIRRCAIVLEPKLVRTSTAPRRPFQGWRYLPEGDSPADLRRAGGARERLSPGLAAALVEIGVIQAAAPTR